MANLSAALSSTTAMKPKHSQTICAGWVSSTRLLITSCWNLSGAAASSETRIASPISRNCRRPVTRQMAP